MSHITSNKKVVQYTLILPRLLSLLHLDWTDLWVCTHTIGHKKGYSKQRQEKNRRKKQLNLKILSTELTSCSESCREHFSTFHSHRIRSAWSPRKRRDERIWGSTTLLLPAAGIATWTAKKKKSKKTKNLIINVFCILQITLFEGNPQIFCYNPLMILIEEHKMLSKVNIRYHSRVKTILRVSSEYLPGYSTQQRQQQVFNPIMWLLI